MITIPDALRRPAEVERDELRRRLQALEEREAACCPEDVPFDEYIRALVEQLGRARAEIESKSRLIEQMREALRLALPEARSTHVEWAIKIALKAERGERVWRS